MHESKSYGSRAMYGHISSYLILKSQKNLVYSFILLASSHLFRFCLPHLCIFVPFLLSPKQSSPSPFALFDHQNPQPPNVPLNPLALLLVQHTPRRPSGAHRRPTKRHTCACPHAIRRSPFGIPLIPLHAGGPQEAISPRPRRILAARFECTIPNGRATLSASRTCRRPPSRH